MAIYRHCSRPASRTGTTRATSVTRSAALALVLLLQIPAGIADLSVLTLADAEQLAMHTDPSVAALDARRQALADSAVADGQLPDPKLKTGLYNLPLDDFDISREPTTQWRIGLEQAFPRGDTLRFRQQRGEWLARSGQADAELAQRSLLRDVRNSYLELSYQLQAEQIIDGSRDLFAQLVDITRAHYASGRASQQDVLRAELELSRLDDRSTRIRNEADRARAALGKWIGDDARRPLQAGFPALPELPALAALEAALPEHPAIRSKTARVEADNRAIRIAREQYKPGWSAGLEYRKRFGEDPDGSDRADMMAAMLSVELPLFPNNRQDRQLSSAILRTEAAQLERDEQMRELKKMLASEYANWQRLGERAALHESRLLPESAANAKASLNAYRSGTTEFTTLMRARLTELDVRLDAQRIRTDLAMTHARLLYLAGE